MQVERRRDSIQLRLVPMLAEQVKRRVLSPLDSLPAVNPRGHWPFQSATERVKRVKVRAQLPLAILPGEQGKGRAQWPLGIRLDARVRQRTRWRWAHKQDHYHNKRLPLLWVIRLVNQTRVTIQLRLDIKQVKPIRARVPLS
jgi:hypothetical protein